MNETVQSEYENLSLRFKADSPFLYAPSRTLLSGRPLKLQWHEQMEIKYIISGTLEMVCGSKVIQAKPGDIVIINPCERHANQVKREAVTYHLLLVNLVSDMFGTPFREYSERNFGFYNLIRGDTHIAQCLLQIIDALCASNDVSLIRANGWFLVLFSYLYDQYRDSHFSAESPKNRRQEDIVETVIAHIYHHYADDIHISDIATKCFVSDSHLCRVFREMTGKTPVTYLQEFRINKAAIFLENTDQSVADIAERVGFCNPSYFCRCFRKLKGMTPRQYRQKRFDGGCTIQEVAAK